MEKKKRTAVLVPKKIVSLAPKVDEDGNPIKGDYAEVI